jgi:hypothetical protein
MSYSKGEPIWYFRTNPQRRVKATFVDAKGVRCRITIQEGEAAPRTVSVGLDCIDKVRAEIPGFVPEATFRCGR